MVWGVGVWCVCGEVCVLCVCGCGGRGGGCSDVELDAHLCRYTSVGAPNWGGRDTWESDSWRPHHPGAGLNIQMDGSRKMQQSCKLPLNRHHHASQ